VLEHPGAGRNLQGGPDVSSVVAGDSIPRKTEITLSAWAGEWLAFSVHLKPKTRVGYESLLRVQILPSFGGTPLDAIDGLAIRRWVASLHGTGLSASRIRQSYQVLRQLLSSAVDCGLLEQNPSERLKLPRDSRSEMSCITAEEVERLAEAVPIRYKPLIHVLAYGGLRWGEASALRRGRCDLDAGLLLVAESISDVNGKVVFGQTKTYRVRKTRIPDFLVSELRDHLERVAPRPDALVFTAERGGPLRNANFRNRVWYPALDVAGLPRSIRIHDLRHTCASLLIRQGVHPKAIQHHLGHSSINITMDRYGHLLPDQFDDLVSQLDLVHTDVAVTELSVREVI
jgi:integrase